MKIDRIFVKNIGPFDELDLRLDGEPVALVGANASGKTFLLSSVVDFILEHFKALGFDDALPSLGSGYRYYRKTSPQFCKDKMKPGLIWIEGRIGKEKLYYLEEYGIEGVTQASEIVKRPQDVIPWPKNEFAKNINHLQNDNVAVAKKIVRRESIFFLPATKFENESWKTEEFFRTDYSTEDSTINKLGHPIQMFSSIRENEIWLVNERMDKDLYPQQEQHEARINLVSKILALLLGVKAGCSLCFSPNWNDRLTVIDNDGQSTISSLSHLSLGQMSVLNLVLNIMRLGDSSALPQEITGLVVIDEIDTHLTGDYKTIIIPEIIKFFPNVQFIITTHDPESVAGLENNSQIRLIELPSGKDIFARNFSELKKARENLKTISDNTRRIIDEVRHTTKPVLIVEDEYVNIYKVGWLKAHGKPVSKRDVEAVFKAEAPFGIVSANGAANLQAFLDLPSIPSNIGDKKIVGLFDFDTAYIRFNGLNKNGWPKDIEGSDETGLFKKNQNSGHIAMVLPVPKNRKNIASSTFAGKSLLTIELYFNDDILGEKNYKLDTSTPNGLKKFAGDKPTFWEECINYPEEAFANFTKLFNQIETFLDVDSEIK